MGGGPCLGEKINEKFAFLIGCVVDCISRLSRRALPVLMQYRRRDLWSRYSRSAGACPPRCFKNLFFIVARGPVPRERWIARTLARDRPSPYGTARRFFRMHRFRSYGPKNRFFLKGAFCRRGPGRRAGLLHRDREVSPTGTSLASRPGGLSYTNL